ncbi:MAG: hypothetical protein IIC67_05690 [Thaumarchaeota archaeon]|nr:hypothetical protein [Nitrososphaerota archaeon]
MAFVCKDICHKMEIENKNDVSYSYNQKYCSVCDKFLLIYISRCPCCGTILRVDRKNKRRQKNRTNFY